MIREGMVLRRIQDLQQRRRRIPPEIPAHLIHLVQHQHGVLHAGPADRLNNPPRHGADVGAPVPSELSFIMNAAKADPFKAAPQCPRD